MLLEEKRNTTKFKLVASSLNWTQPNQWHAGSKCSLKMHVRNLGYPLQYKSGTQNHPFSTTSQLNNDNFSGLYLHNSKTGGGMTSSGCSRRYHSSMHGVSFLCLVYFLIVAWLSVPVQSIVWKDSSPKWPI